MKPCNNDITFSDFRDKDIAVFMMSLIHNLFNFIFKNMGYLALHYLQWIINSYPAKLCGISSDT